ncbi:MAG: ice-binding family protein [Minisyncoccia bacterium]
MKKLTLIKKSLPVFALLALAVGSFGITPQIVYAVAIPPLVDLGTAGDYTILTKTGISTTGPTSVVGDMGVSPSEATSITGFALSLTEGSPFSTSALVAGKIYAPGYAAPTPTNLTTAISDMETAYTTANGLAPGVTELGAGNIGGLTIVPGVYKWTTGVIIPADVTLSGNADDVWVFQIAQNLDISSATQVLLSGGAQAKNIFWIVAGQTTIGTTAVFIGNILDKTAIVLNTGATLNGRALAQTAVTLDSNYVSNVGNKTIGTITGTVGGFGVLKVDSIETIDNTAIADGTFASGWEYIFNITIPSNETNLAMKFADWVQTGGPGIIATANNIRISSLQADNGGTTVLLTGANLYSSPTLHMITDLNPATDGIQIKVKVEVAVPTGSLNGAYTTSYGVKTN